MQKVNYSVIHYSWILELCLKKPKSKQADGTLALRPKDELI